MVWTLAYNIIRTKSAKSLFKAQHYWSGNECQTKSIMPGSYVCLLIAPQGTTEQGAVYVRYTGPNGRPTTVRSLLILLP